MCDFCGCGMVRVSERAASKTNARGKPVGIVVVAAKSRGHRTIAAYSDRKRAQRLIGQRRGCYLPPGRESPGLSKMTSKQGAER